MTMKKTDYQVKKSNTKIKYSKAVTINDKDMVIVIELTQNHNKGLYTVSPKVTTDLITGKDGIDKALMTTIADLMYEAVKDAEAWRQEWKENNPNNDIEFDFMPGIPEMPIQPNNPNSLKGNIVSDEEKLFEEQGADTFTPEMPTPPDSPDNFNRDDLNPFPSDEEE